MKKKSNQRIPRWKVLRNYLLRLAHGKKPAIKYDRLESILRKHTNWQNSQWMRAGGPGLHYADEQTAAAKNFLKMKKPAKDMN